MRKLAVLLLSGLLSSGVATSALATPVISVPAQTVSSRGPAPVPDYSSQIALMESLSYPLQQGTGGPAKKSWVYGGSRDKEELYPSYRAARKASRDAHFRAGSTRTPPQMTAWADCGGYVSTVVKNTVDPYFPWLITDIQRDYLEDPSNGWVRVGDTRNYRPSDYQLGDVMVASGHIMFWVGEWQGYEEVVNDAALSYDETTRSGRMPGFRIAGLARGISKETGDVAMVDSFHRDYDVYRYTGGLLSLFGPIDHLGSAAATDVSRPLSQKSRASVAS